MSTAAAHPDRPSSAGLQPGPRWPGMLVLGAAVLTLHALALQSLMTHSAPAGTRSDAPVPVPVPAPTAAAAPGPATAAPLLTRTLAAAAPMRSTVPMEQTAPPETSVPAAVAATRQMAVTPPVLQVLPARATSTTPAAAPAPTPAPTPASAPSTTPATATVPTPEPAIRAAAQGPDQPPLLSLAANRASAPIAVEVASVRPVQNLADPTNPTGPAQLTQASASAATVAAVAAVAEASAVPAAASVGATAPTSATASTDGDAALRPTPVYATRLPPPATLAYDLRSGNLSGRGKLVWRPDQAAYELALEGSVFGFTAISQSSRGRLDRNGLAPERFLERRRGRAARAANFQRNAGLISFSEPSVTYPWRPGVQDRLSWMLQLPAIVEAEPALRRVGAEVQMLVVGARGDAEVWTFVVRSNDTLVLPSGPVAGALHLLRLPQDEFSTRVDVWLDPGRHHLPVRMRMQSGDKDEVFELRLEAFATP